MTGDEIMDTDGRADRLDSMLRDVSTSIASMSATAPVLPEPGQLWRARWDDVLSLVFIDAVLEGANNLVRVAPVRIGTDEADDSTIIVPAGSNALAIELSVWPSLVTEIAEVVLERWVTTFEDRFRSLAAIEEAAETGALRRGTPILNEDSPRLRDRRLLELAMKLLAIAARLPSGSGELGSFLAGVLVTSLAATLHVQNSVALKIVRGDAFIDGSQAERLALLVQRKPSELLAANPTIPDDLVDTLTSSKRSQPVRMLAKKENLSESEAFAQMARDCFALAARGERPGVRDWSGRVDTYLRMALADS
jgi:hypothetical protein